LGRGSRIKREEIDKKKLGGGRADKRAYEGQSRHVTLGCRVINMYHGGRKTVISHYTQKEAKEVYNEKIIGARNGANTGKQKSVLVRGKKKKKTTSTRVECPQGGAQ